MDELPEFPDNGLRLTENPKRNRDLVALHRVSLDVIIELHTPRLLETLLQNCVLLLGAQGASLCIYDSSLDLIRNVANYHLNRDWRGLVMLPGEGIMGQAVATGTPLLVNDYRNWNKKYKPFTDYEPYTRGIGAPLKYHGEILGAINVFDGPQAPPFDAEHVWLLSSFADVAGVAFGNAKQYESAVQFSAELESKVEEGTHRLVEAEAQIAVKAEQLKSLLARTIRMQEEEQARIAREMHDGVMQLITATRYELKAARLAIASERTPLAEGKIEAARELLAQAENAIRDAIFDMHPPSLDDEGLVAALQKHVARFYQVSGIACELTTCGLLRSLSPSQELAVYRIVTEALQNVSAHSGAKKAWVVLEFGCSALQFIINDDGQGFEYHELRRVNRGKHLGLLSMRERIENMGGSMEVRTGPAAGTRLIFSLPLHDRCETRRAMLKPDTSR